MRGKKTLLVANFVCRFGDQLVLLDFLDEIVLQAFLKPGRVRKYADKSYFFLKPQIVDLSSRGNVEKAIAGRLVKITTLVREQILVNGELVEDHAQLESAPSSLFVLLLSNHKLLFVRETKDAPSLEAFGSTAHRFMLDAHAEYVSLLREESEKLGQRMPRSDLLFIAPRPSVEVVPLSTGSTLGAFINRFDQLSSVQIRLIDPNDELDNSKLFEDLRDAQEGTGATSAEVEFKNSSKDGLDKKAVKQLLENPVAQGNSKIFLVGKDKNGEVLRGNNEDFKLIVPLDLNVDTIKQAAIKIYNTFKTVQELLKIPPLPADMKEKIKKLGL